MKKGTDINKAYMGLLIRRSRLLIRKSRLLLQRSRLFIRMSGLLISRFRLFIRMSRLLIRRSGQNEKQHPDVSMFGWVRSNVATYNM